MGKDAEWHKTNPSLFPQKKPFSLGNRITHALETEVCRCCGHASTSSTNMQLSWQPQLSLGNSSRPLMCHWWMLTTVACSQSCCCPLCGYEHLGTKWHPAEEREGWCSPRCCCSKPLSGWRDAEGSAVNIEKQLAEVAEDVEIGHGDKGWWMRCAVVVC